MLGINGIEFILLGFLAVIIVGPERLPGYAAQLGQLVRNLRTMASGAREQLREEMGPEIDDVDWRKLDPRQYDPRRIIREALIEDLGDDRHKVIKPVDAGTPEPAPNPLPPTPPTPTPTPASVSASVSASAPASAPVSDTPPDSRPPTSTTPTVAPVTGGASVASARGDG